MTTNKKKKQKRAINSKPMILICLLGIALIGFIKVPGIVEFNKLAALEFDEEAIENIYKHELEDIILEKDYYTTEFNEALKMESFDKNYLTLHLTMRTISDDQKLLFDRLKAKNYSDNQISDLYQQLEFFEITPLLVFDYQSDTSAYVADCIENRTKNSKDAFFLTNSYRVLYDETNTKPVDALGTFTMNVSKTYYLPDDYVPAKLVPLAIKYASDDVQMEEEAALQFIMMCDTMVADELRMYATNAYRSFERQSTLYDNYVKRDGEEKADAFSARAGFSEHQTGLTADVASIKNEMVDFGESAEYTWMQSNAHLYGFIQRYPKDKTTITGYQEESWHWRYIGSELATKVKESKFTYDEYYELYLAPTVTPATDTTE